MPKSAQPFGAGQAVRVLLDTNLWSRVGDEGSGRDLERLIEASAIEIVLPPSTLIEVVQLPVEEPRQRIIQVMASGRRRRLASEAEMEAREVVEEIRRHHPAWLRRFPDTGKVATLHGFWTKKIWREALIDASRLHEYQRGQSPTRDLLVGVQRAMRTEVIRTEFDPRPLTAVMATPNPMATEDYLMGWDGSPAEAWRVAARDVLWHAVRIAGRAPVTKEDTTYADWLGAYVDLVALRRDAHVFTSFWLHEVDVRQVPRQWLRWAVNTAQSMFKVTGGNPADEQHSSYLVDCDLFLTADSRYVEVLKVVREDAPFQMADAVKVGGPSNAPIVNRIEKALEGLI
jgi:hypothetical protein